MLEECIKSVQDKVPQQPQPSTNQPLLNIKVDIKNKSTSQKNIADAKKRTLIATGFPPREIRNVQRFLKVTA